MYYNKLVYCSPYSNAAAGKRTAQTAIMPTENSKLAQFLLYYSQAYEKR
jgi:hypothetical protein